MSHPTGLLTDPPLLAPRGNNPFVGPRSIQQGERIHGRKREIIELRDRLIADRIVLMYSPSGAGKTSLINAGLRPELESRGFIVLPTIRINHVDDELSHVAGSNRYRLSMLQSLEEGRAPDHRIEPAALASMSLTEYFDGVVAQDGAERDHCLVFDQFEELLTLDSSDLEAKAAFIDELGQVLRDRRWWVLLSMREDYVAPLDPYLDLMPTRLSSHYRLELLGAEAATAAVREAAAGAGVQFAPEAADKLINDLRLVRVQRGDEIVATPGAYVEPVQLQVVCSQLWDRLAPAARSVELADVSSLGNVDDALAGYYEQRVGAAAEESGVSEREIRQWIEDALITEHGFRTQSLVWAREGGDKMLASLENSHLVRTETHRGARWYELAHDRLVDPIRDANKTWRTEHLSVLQARSGEWYQLDKPTGLLIGGQVLADAERWAAEHADELNQVDAEYLAKSRVMEQSARRLRRSSRRNLILAIAAVLLAVAAGLLWVNAQRSADEARAAENRAVAERIKAEQAEQAALAAEQAALAAEQAALDAEQDALEARDRALALQRVAQAGELAARSRALQLDNPALALAVAAESTMVATEAPNSTYAAIAGARSTFRSPTWQPGSDGIEQPEARHVAVSPDGDTFASAGCAPEAETRCDATTIYLRSLPGGVEASTVASGHAAAITDLAFGPGGVLASASADGTIRLWNPPSREPLAILDLAGQPVSSMGFDPTGAAALVVGDDDGGVWLWDLSGEQPVGRELDRGGLPRPDRVNDVTIRFDGKLIASAESSGDVVLWDISTGRPIRQLTYFREPDEARREALSVAFFPDRQPLPCPEDLNLPGCVDMLVVGHEDGMLWRWENPNSPFPDNPFPGDPPISGPQAVRMPPHAGDVNALSFDTSGSGLLASASDDRTIKLWKFEKLTDGDDAGARLVTAVGAPLLGHGGSVTDVAFFADGTRVVSSSNDDTLRLWGAPDDDAVLVEELGEAVDCGDDPRCGSTAVAFSADDRLLASTGLDGVVRFWSPQEATLVYAATGSQPMYALAFDPRADRLIVGGHGRVWSWHRDAPNQLTPLWTDEGFGALEAGDRGLDDVPAVRAVAFDGATGFAASADECGVIRIHDVATSTVLDERGESCRGDTGLNRRGAIDAITFHSDGQLIYGDARGATFSVELSSTGRLGDPVQIGTAQDEAISGVDVSDADDNGDRFVATGSENRTVRVTMLSGDRPGVVGDLRGHRGEVTAVAFSDSYLVSASDDGTIRLWWLNPKESRIDAVPATGEPLLSSPGCRDASRCAVRGLAISNDSSTVASVGSDGVVHLWPGLIDPEVACQLAEPLITRQQIEDQLDDGARAQVCFQ